MTNEQLTDACDSFTLGPLEAGPACCDPQPVIEVKNLSLRYHGKLALKQVSLDIYKGCITALIGPSGCGKTSLLSAVNRLTDLIPGCSVNGRILVQGRNIYDPDVNVQTLRRQVGMVFQKPTPFHYLSAVICRCRCMSMASPGKPK